MTQRIVLSDKGLDTPFASLHSRVVVSVMLPIYLPLLYVGIQKRRMEPHRLQGYDEHVRLHRVLVFIDEDAHVCGS
jgi:hypothetical protein